ncbi:MAG: diadenylate cyclase CdaA [Defluviitaleaceae bacterium]|nr:diadenylate cyclase CdaA [Defluviitaleaceae bacterium]MCL2835908.1 diadenylate cyclase CdaA [Defluviitaleaceae bacterium]
MTDFFNWVAGTLNFTDLRMPGIEISSIADILIVAYLIYKVLVFAARTRAWTLIKGISLLAVVYMLSDIFKLHTIRWLISNTFNVGLIAIIIIFQPEVRKALEQIGKGTKLVITGVDENTEEDKQNVLDEIIDACKKMSAVRTGALIVIENEVPLGDIESTGTKLDARVTNQLLVSIFEDKMPLHDGAVVISKGRLASAGCLLPLTEKEIGAEHGTRHRAAVGISEESDAHVIIVSNETGHISIATGGRLYKNLSEDEIRSMLYGMRKPPKRKLVSFFKTR